MSKKIAIIKFQNSIKGYHFFTDIEDLKKDDLLVVDTMNGYQLGTFDSYYNGFGEERNIQSNPFDKTYNNPIVVPSNYHVVTTNTAHSESIKASKWVVSKVDLELHLSRLEQHKKLKMLEKNLEQKAKEVERFKVLEILAATDESMKEMLDEYKKLKAEVL